MKIMIDVVVVISLEVKEMTMTTADLHQEDMIEGGETEAGKTVAQKEIIMVARIEETEEIIALVEAQVLHPNVQNENGKTITGVEVAKNPMP